jgi:hypothetical protein
VIAEMIPATTMKNAAAKADSAGELMLTILELRPLFFGLALPPFSFPLSLSVLFRFT